MLVAGRLLAATALTALAAIGCTKDSIDKKAVAPAVKGGLAALPKDAAMVFGVNVAKARGTAAWAKYAPQFLANLPPEMAELKAACGLDPVTQIDTMLVSLGADIEDQKAPALVLQGQFSEEKVGTCMTDLAAKDGDQVEIVKDGKVTTYRSKASAKALHAVWVAPDTVAMAPGVIEDAAAAKALAANAGADQNKQLGEMMALIDTGAVFWGVGTLPQVARDQMKQMGYVPDGFFVAVDVTDDVDLAFGLRYEDDKSAESSFKFFKMGLDQVRENPPLPMLKDLMATVEVKHTGRMVKVTGSLTMAQLEQLVGMAAAMGGGLGL